MTTTTELRARPAPDRGTTRLGQALLGACAVVIGVLLLINPFAAVRSLALLVALALAIGGVMEIVTTPRGERRWTVVLTGTILVVGGLLAVVWPGATLWSLALITGVSLAVHGVAITVAAVADRRTIPGWGWLVVGGLCNLVIGILALLRPTVTVVVLGLLLGVQILVFGAALLAAAVLSRNQRPSSGRTSGGVDEPAPPGGVS